MPVEWRTEAGLTFLYLDYRGETTDEYFATLAEAVRIVEASPPGQRLLVHSDPDDRPESHFLSEVKRTMRESLAPRGTRVAFIGTAGLGLAVVRGLNLVGGGIGSPVFPTREKALAYLAKG